MDKTTREIKENNDNNEWRYQRPISSGSIGRYPDVAVDMWNIGTVIPVCNALKDSGPVPSMGRFKVLMAFMMDAKKDLRVDMEENFPCLGLYDRTKASTVLPGGDVLLLYLK